jgi:hypothetical protein
MCGTEAILHPRPLQASSTMHQLPLA